MKGWTGLPLSGSSINVVSIIWYAKTVPVSVDMSKWEDWFFHSWIWHQWLHTAPLLRESDGLSVSRHVVYSWPLFKRPPRTSRSHEIRKSEPTPWCQSTCYLRKVPFFYTPWNRKCRRLVMKILTDFSRCDLIYIRTRGEADQGRFAQSFYTIARFDVNTAPRNYPIDIPTIRGGAWCMKRASLFFMDHLENAPPLDIKDDDVNKIYFLNDAIEKYSKWILWKTSILICNLQSAPDMFSCIS